MWIVTPRISTRTGNREGAVLERCRRRRTRAGAARRWSPTCVVSVGQCGIGDRPATGDAAAEEGRGVGEVWLDRDLACGDRAWSARATRRERGSRPRRLGRAAPRGSSRCAARSEGARRCARRARPRRSAVPESSSADTNWLESDASSSTRPPRSEPSAVHGERERVRGSRRRCRHRARGARRERDASDASGRRGRRRMRRGRARARRPAGTNRMTVPARPQSMLVDPVSSSVGVTPQIWSVGVLALERVDAGPKRPQRLDHEVGIARVQWHAERAWAVGERREHELAAGQRLRPGEWHVGVHLGTRRACLGRCRHSRGIPSSDGIVRDIARSGAVVVISAIQSCSQHLSELTRLRVGNEGWARVQGFPWRKG